MKRSLSTLLIFLLSCACSTLSAQESAATSPTTETPTDESPRPVTCAVTMQLGSSKVRNTYLTPLPYTGNTLGLQLERWRLMPSFHWTAQQRLDMDMAFGSIANGNASMNSGRMRYRYALMRGWQFPALHSSLLVGPYAGLEVGFDYNLKMAAGNNPAAVRLCNNLGLSAATATHFRLRRQDCSVMLQVQAPLIGVAMMPEYGASYYETFLLQNTDNTSHFTSLHNQQDLDLRLTTDLPMAVIFPHWDWTLRVGGSYRIETMQINHITTRYSAFEFVIGWSYQYLPYNRKKSHYLKSSVYEAY